MRIFLANWITNNNNNNNKWLQFCGKFYFSPSAARKKGFCLWIPGPAGQYRTGRIVSCMSPLNSFFFIPLGKAEQAKYSKLSRHVQKNVFLCHVDLSTPVLANKTQIIKHYKVKFFLVEMPVWSTAYQSVCINTVLLVGKSTVSSKWRRWDCLCSSILLLSTHQTSLCPAHFALLCLFPYFRGRNTGFWINMLQNTAHEYLI